MAQIPKRAEFRLLKGQKMLNRILEMLGISVLVVALGFSFIVAVCFSVRALANG